MNDETIIEQIKKKNMYVWEEIINTYKKKIFSMAYKFTGDYNEAQDLSQEIFIKVFNKIESFNCHSSLSTWIYKVAVNTCMDYKRKKKFMFLPLIETSRQYDNPEEKTISKEDTEQIHNTVTKLPGKYKTVIILYHFNELSYEKISEILNIPVKTVETRLYRGRKKLKKLLSSYCFGGELSEM